MRTPAISIIVPCYNVGDDVADTLDSILAQTETDFEAILVNDGSTDRTALHLHAYAQADPRFRVIDKPNGGLPSARNAGLTVARGQRIAFLDAGDTIEPGAFQILNAELGKHPEAGAACGSWRFVDPRGHAAGGSANLPEWIGGPVNPWLDFADFTCTNPVNTNSLLFNRRWLDQAGQFDGTLPHCTCEDWDYWARVARGGCRFRGLQVVTSSYRMKPGSGSRRVGPMLEAGFLVIQRTHGPDLQCISPDPRFARGAAPDGLRAACTSWASYCAASAFSLGGQAEADAILRQAAGRIEVLDPVALARHLCFAIPYNRCVFPQAWPRLWTECGAELADWLDRLGTSYRDEQFTRSCLSHLRRLTGAGETVSRLIDAVNRQLGRRSLVLYGTGRNGRTLRDELRNHGIHPLMVDDADETGGIAPLLPIREDLLVVVTPWNDRPMCDRLAASGAIQGRDFITWNEFADVPEPDTELDVQCPT